MRLGSPDVRLTRRCPESRMIAGAFQRLATARRIQARSRVCHPAQREAQSGEQHGSVSDCDGSAHGSSRLD